jgi:hypothetical protein
MENPSKNYAKNQPKTGKILNQMIDNAIFYKKPYKTGR